MTTPFHSVLFFFPFLQFFLVLFFLTYFPHVSFPAFCLIWFPFQLWPLYGGLQWFLPWHHFVFCFLLLISFTFPFLHTSHFSQIFDCYKLYSSSTFPPLYLLLFPLYKALFSSHCNSFSRPFLSFIFHFPSFPFPFLLILSFPVVFLSHSLLPSLFSPLDLAACCFHGSKSELQTCFQMDQSSSKSPQHKMCNVHTHSHTHTGCKYAQLLHHTTSPAWIVGFKGDN